MDEAKGQGKAMNSGSDAPIKDGRDYLGMCPNFSVDMMFLMFVSLRLMGTAVGG